MGKPFTYGSVCSGIEAATAAWHPLGWKPAFFSEIEPFPRAVLAHHYPSVPLHGDFTTIQDKDYEPIDLLVGGTPCQSFSVAGLRGGLSDDRGNLALEFLRLAQRLRPRWLVWENVPGVLSSGGGRDFGSILGGLVELGYGFAYRVLDAQYFGVPQRRRRVFVVAYLGDAAPARAVLFERHSLQGNPAPRRQAGERVAGTVKGGSGERGYPDPSDGNDGGLVALPVVGSLCADSHPGGYSGQDAYTGRLIPSCQETALTLRGRPNASHRADSDTYLVSAVTPPLTHNPYGDHESREGLLVPTLMRMREGCDGGGKGPLLSEDRSLTLKSDSNDQVLFAVRTANTSANGQSVAIPIGIDGSEIGFALRANASASGDKGDGGVNTTMVAYAIKHDKEPKISTNRTGTLQASNGGSDRNYAAAPMDRTFDANLFEPKQTVSGMQVRRLMPVECERLQGFADGFTEVPYRGKPANQCPYGPRYKALGNSMAVDVMQWIGERIQMVEDFLQIGGTK